MGCKYAGVTLDWYDDKGETLKRHMPDPSSLPDFIKEANITSPETVPDENYALIAIDSGTVLRKYACVDAGTTAMSTLYFLEHGNKLPDEAVKVAAANLTEACLVHGLEPPVEIVQAADPEKLANVVDRLRRVPKATMEVIYNLKDVLKRAREAVSPSHHIKTLGKNIEEFVESGGKTVSKTIQESAGDLADAAAKQIAPGAAAGMAAGGIAGGLASGDLEGARRGAGRGLLAGTFGAAGGRAIKKGPAGSAIGGALAGLPAGGLFGPGRTKEAGVGLGMLAGAAGLGALGGASANPDNRLAGAAAGTVGGIPGSVLGGIAGGVGGGVLGSLAGYGAGRIAPKKVSDLAMRALKKFKSTAGEINPGATAEELLENAPQIFNQGKGINRIEGLTPEGSAAVAATLGSIGGGALGTLVGAPVGAYKGGKITGGMTVDEREPVDITGKSPSPQVKESSARSVDDFAVVTHDGQCRYPIRSWDDVKTAEAYYQEESIRMHPEMRRQYAVKLASRANIMGYPLDGSIQEDGAVDYAPVESLKESIDLRKVACDPGYAREFLDDLLEKSASIHPDVYAECLKRFDIDQGLDRGWDYAVPNPWVSTYGLDKVAKVVWEEGSDRVTEAELKNLATNEHSGLQELFNEEIASSFIKSPIEIFNSMPLPQKKVIARLAVDLSSQGRSEGFAA